MNSSELQKQDSVQEIAESKTTEKKRRLTISQERLKDVLDYNPHTGVFTWKVRTSNRVKVGDVAGDIESNGYLRISIDGNRFRAHRLAIIYVYGDNYYEQVDHINHVRTDNRISNLRVATHSQNNWNQQLQIKNTSGIKGVYWDKSRKKWSAYCCVMGKRHMLGRFSDIKLAENAVKNFRAKMHGEFSFDG